MKFPYSKINLPLQNAKKALSDTQDKWIQCQIELSTVKLANIELNNQLLVAESIAKGRAKTINTLTERADQLSANMGERGVELDQLKRELAYRDSLNHKEDVHLNEQVTKIRVALQEIELGA